MQSRVHGRSTSQGKKMKKERFLGDVFSQWNKDEKTKPESQVYRCLDPCLWMLSGKWGSVLRWSMTEWWPGHDGRGAEGRHWNPARDPQCPDSRGQGTGQCMAPSGWICFSCVAVFSLHSVHFVSCWPVVFAFRFFFFCHSCLWVIPVDCIILTLSFVCVKYLSVSVVCHLAVLSFHLIAVLSVSVLSFIHRLVGVSCLSFCCFVLFVDVLSASVLSFIHCLVGVSCFVFSLCCFVIAIFHCCSLCCLGI